MINPEPLLYEEHEVLERLNLRGHELEGLLNVGIIEPVARGVMGQPLYDAEAVAHLATREQGRRLADALWWDFDLQRPSYLPGHLPWARAVDLPCYPFDTNGKIIAREACTLNNFKDVRTCINWDDGTSHQNVGDGEKVQLVGQSIYSDDLGTDADFWRSCAQERGDGYRNKVNRHNASWFEADPGKDADLRAVDRVSMEWTKAVAGVKELMPNG
ncbi:hypothetical protein [Bradyrhizobium ganzhouense]|uniref:hypothetical protein n=1 Tax=Bradyrhizobium ganzhouense TaxID=1179767 RepID=UPI003CEB0927